MHSAANSLGSCAGNACSDVNVTYTNQGYQITNHGRKRVSISIRFIGGGSLCAGPAGTELGAGEEFIPNNTSGFCNPYQANYLRQPRAGHAVQSAGRIPHFTYRLGSTVDLAAEPTTIVVQGAHTYKITELHSAANTLGSCAGNACSDVKVTYTNQGYQITNHGRRRVNVSIRWTIGGISLCAGAANVELDAGVEFIPNTNYSGFCNPYHANYLR